MSEVSGPQSSRPGESVRSIGRDSASQFLHQMPLSWITKPTTGWIEALAVSAD